MCAVFFVWWLLLLNAVWDLISFLSVSLGCCNAIGNMHVGLWVNADDRTNPVAVLFMVFALLALFAARACVCLDLTFWPVAVCSYAIECAFAAVGVYAGLMQFWSGLFVAVSSALLGLLVGLCV